MKADKVFYEKAGVDYDTAASAAPFQYFIQQRKKMLASIPLEGRKRVVLDLGCGTGIYETAYPKEHIVVGSDYSLTALKQFRSRFAANRIINADARSIPFRDNSIDAIIMFGLAHHLYSSLKTLFLEIRRVLKKDGIVIIDEPNGYNLAWFLVLWSEIGREIDGCFSRPITPRTLNAALKEHNFSIIYQRYWGFFPLCSFRSRFFSAINTFLEETPLKVMSARFTVIGKKEGCL